MRQDLQHELVAKLTADYQFKRNSAGWLRQGRCPNCQKKELFTKEESPWVIKCGRLNKCGSEWHVKDLYPDLFEDWSKRYQPTKTDPAASAKAYLQYARGFDLSVVGQSFTQESYYNKELNAGSATVRFALQRGGYWERIIDKAHRFGNMKARFAPGQSYRGNWWKPPSVDLSKVKELWIVEGIFDALALLHHDISAVAAMSSNAWPEESLTQLAADRRDNLPTLVWALDGDSSGRSYTRKWVKKAREMGFKCKAAQIYQQNEKIDWNDQHQRGKLEAHHIEDYLHQGALLIAETAIEKGTLIFLHRELNQFHFTFEDRLYWFMLDQGKFTKALQTLEDRATQKDLEQNEAKLRKAALKQSVELAEIANCAPQALYFQRNEVTDESWYYFRVTFPHDGPPVKGTFTGGQLSASGEFKKRLLSLAAGAVFTGSSVQLDRIMKYQLFNVKTVQTMDYIGYNPTHKAYVFGDTAVRHGVIHHANEEDFFDFGKLRLKTLQKSININLQTHNDNYNEDWFTLLWQCFGVQGVVALAFWLGSLFAEQIRAQQKSFPFLEVTGEAGAGKTTLLMFLWKLFGRDYEGFDPSKSSHAGRSRAMGQISNMPVVMIEGDRNDPDRANAKSFDWDELKDFFGGGTLRTRGVKNSGNDTYEPPFRGTIVISQNADVDASEAILTRIVKLHFKRPVATQQSREAASALNRLPIEKLSHFMLKAVQAEADIMGTILERSEEYEKRLREKDEIRTERVIKNHSQLMACVDALSRVTPITNEQRKETLVALEKMARQRHSAITADHPLVAEFWEIYEYIEATREEPVLNHSANPDTIAINLNEFAELAAEYKQRLPDMRLLRPLIKQSVRHKFIDANRPVHSNIRATQNLYPNAKQRPTTIKCWLFEG